MVRFRRVFATVAIGVVPALAAAATGGGRKLAAPSTCDGDRVAALELVMSPPAPRAGEAALLTFRINVMCPMSIPWRIDVDGRPLALGTHASPPGGGVLVMSATWAPARAGDVTLRKSAHREHQDRPIVNTEIGPS